MKFCVGMRMGRGSQLNAYVCTNIYIKALVLIVKATQGGLDVGQKVCELNKLVDLVDKVQYW